MQIIKQPINITKNGKGGRWKKGVIHVPPAILDMVGWDTSECYLLFGSLKNKEELEKAIENAIKIDELEEEIKRIKASKKPVL